jgi:hypothetical protein
MPSAQDYQQRAAGCLRLARGTANPTNKALLLEMAQTWVKLAEQAQAPVQARWPAFASPSEIRTVSVE